MLIGMPVAGRLYNRLGPRLMLGVGLLLAAFGSWEMGYFTLSTSYIGFAIPQIWQGVAFSLIFVSLSTAALVAVPRRRMTNATALYNLIRQIGASFGIAIVATLLEKHIAFQTSLLSAHINPYNPNFVTTYSALQSGLIGQGVAVTEAPAKALAVLGLMTAQQASVLGYEYVFRFVAIILAATFPLVFLLHSKQELSREHLD
jgi:DHA2 family multidrug resistance protein